MAHQKLSTPIHQGVIVHTCHWPTCKKEVPPAMWGCKFHWFKLPFVLRKEIWRTYVPGQEITKDPSAEYLKAADAVQKWACEEIRTGRMQ